MRVSVAFLSPRASHAASVTMVCRFPWWPAPCCKRCCSMSCRQDVMLIHRSEQTCLPLYHVRSYAEIHTHAPHITSHAECTLCPCVGSRMSGRVDSRLAGPNMAVLAQGPFTAMPASCKACARARLRACEHSERVCPRACETQVCVACMTEQC